MWPEMSLPAPVPMTEAERSRVTSQRELVFLLEQSPYFLKPDHAVSDRELYNDPGTLKKESRKQNKALLEHFPAKAPEGYYIPPELLGHSKNVKTGGRDGITCVSTERVHRAGKASNLNRLEEREKRSADAGVEGKESKDDEIGNESEELEADELSDDDYAHNHYVSGAESTGSGPDGQLF
ncbi:unnamed protein product [Chrysoparadoxa australica]